MTGTASAAGCSHRSTWRRRPERAATAEDACKDQLSLIKGLKLRLISIGATKVDGDEAVVRATIVTGGQRTSRGFRLAREDGDWKLVGALMATVVVKLGSSIVADDAGEVRTEVLSSVCDEVAARHEAGDELVIVTSGAIARGMRLMGLPVRPSAMEELQAASRSARASSTATTTSCCRTARSSPRRSC